jgi:hypothetical protein
MRVPKLIPILSGIVDILVVASPTTLVPLEKLSQIRRPRFSKPNSVSDSNSHNSTEYSTAWAGAVLRGIGYTSVTGTIVVPAPKRPAGADNSTSYAGSAWVGIDGDTCQNAIIQTGINFYFLGDYVVYGAWYEWYPYSSSSFSGISIRPGQVIQMSVIATSTTSGSVALNNLSTGQSVNHTFTGIGRPLCQTNAEWILEDYTSLGITVPFADFGTVKFQNATAWTSSGSVTPSNANIINLKQSNRVLTNCDSDNTSVTCSYVN